MLDTNARYSVLIQSADTGFPDCIRFVTADVLKHGGHTQDNAVFNTILRGTGSTAVKLTVKAAVQAAGHVPWQSESTFERICGSPMYFSMYSSMAFLRAGFCAANHSLKYADRTSLPNTVI
jgi:hypothetical protein